MKTVYVAGASGEVEMVAGLIYSLEASGRYECKYNWTKDVLAAKAKGHTDRELTEGDRTQFAQADMKAAIEADVFWIVMPTANSIGCWVEMGAALSQASPRGVISGDHRKTVFSALAPVERRFDTHDAALDWLLRNPFAVIGPPRAALAYIQAENRILTVWNMHDRCWCLPGGREEEQDRGDLIATVNRELREELDISGHNVQKLHDAAPNDPERVRRVHIFKAEMVGHPVEKEPGCPFKWMTHEEFLQNTKFKMFYLNFFDRIT